MLYPGAFPGDIQTKESVVILLRQLSVRGSVAMFVAIATLGVLLMAAVAFFQGRSAEDVADQLVTDVKLARASGLLDMMHDNVRGLAFKALLVGGAADAEAKKALRGEFDESRKTMLESLQDVTNQAPDAPIRKAAEDAKPVVERYIASAGSLIDSALASNNTQMPSQQAMEADFKALETQLDELSGLVEKHAEATTQERDVQFGRARVAAALALLATIALTAGFGYSFARVLLGRLGAEPKALREFADHIAGGRLYVRLQLQKQPPHGVAAALIGMRDRLRESVTVIREGADHVASASGQIASGTQDLASRTEMQSESLRHTAGEVGELASNVRRTAGSVDEARELAVQASGVAEQGGEAVRQAVDTMGALTEASSRIAEITNVIDGIAFQTNILALNAAVEAARAGEQGRGFAVVAAEVRTLAQRSAAAAREIKGLIEHSGQTVAASNRLVADAGGSMAGVVEQVRRVAAIIGEISQATQQQTQGIVSVDQTMTKLDHNTQDNAALVEESAAASQSLRDQAQRLAQAVQSFQLAEAG
jgi:methyl-accepting chemotaxis protein